MAWRVRVSVDAMCVCVCVCVWYGCEAQDGPPTNCCTPPPHNATPTRAASLARRRPCLRQLRCGTSDRWPVGSQLGQLNHKPGVWGTRWQRPHAWTGSCGYIHCAFQDRGEEWRADRPTRCKARSAGRVSAAAQCVGSPPAVTDSVTATGQSTPPISRTFSISGASLVRQSSPEESSKVSSGSSFGGTSSRRACSSAQDAATSSSPSSDRPARTSLLG